MDQLAQKSIELVVDIDNTIPPRLMGDPLRLRQILVNLMSNAVKFTEKGKIHIQVYTRKESTTGTELLFKIKDTGIGIKKQVQEKLFNAFTQADGSTTRRYGGTGLGLVISRRIVNMMAGNIWLESELGKGSTFFFTATFNKITKTAAADIDPDESECRNHPDEFFNVNLLLVEDSPINRRVAVEILSQAGIKVTTANNGKEALETISKSNFDIILMDIQMPEMGGLEATRIIRREFKPASLPIVAMTANAMKGDRQQCLAAGMDDYVSKPIDRKQLFTVLRRNLNTSGKNTRPHPTQRPTEALNREAAFSKISSVLNVKEGMDRLGVDLQFYVSIIEEYHNQHKEISQDIRTLIKTGDYKKAFIAAHTLKGASGNISAINLFRLSTDLEKACLDKNKAAIERNLPFIDKQLDLVIDAAKQLKLNNVF